MVFWNKQHLRILEKYVANFFGPHVYFTDLNSDVINEKNFSPKHDRVTYYLKALDMPIKIYNRTMGSKSTGKELLSKNGIKSCISIIGKA